MLAAGMACIAAGIVLGLIIALLEGFDIGATIPPLFLIVLGMFLVGIDWYIHG